VEAATLASSGVAQQRNMEPPVPPSCSDPAIWGKPAGFLHGNHVSEAAHVCLSGCHILDSLSCYMKGCSSGDGCFHSRSHRAGWLARDVRDVRTSLAFLPSFPISSIHMSMWGSPSTSRTRAWGKLPLQTPPLRKWPAGTWINTGTNRHCPAFWWDHPGSPSPSLPPTLAVLNTNAFCHLVILGKKHCS